MSELYTTKIQDPDTGAKFHVQALRQLSVDEAANFAKLHIQKLPPKDRPKRGDLVTINTVAGLRPGL